MLLSIYSESSLFRREVISSVEFESFLVQLAEEGAELIALCETDEYDEEEIIPYDEWEFEEPEIDLDIPEDTTPELIWTVNSFSSEDRQLSLEKLVSIFVDTRISTSYSDVELANILYNILEEVGESTLINNTEQFDCLLERFLAL